MSTRATTVKKKKEFGATTENAFIVSLVEHIKTFSAGKVPEKIQALKGIEMIAYCGGVTFEQVPRRHLSLYLPLFIVLDQVPQDFRYLPQRTAGRERVSIATTALRSMSLHLLPRKFWRSRSNSQKSSYAPSGI